MAVAVRALDRLKEEQEALLDEYRAREGLSAKDQSPLSVAGSPEGSARVSVIGKVTEVVTSDPEYGAHLVATVQEFSGTPPSPSDAAMAPLRVYPSPNRVVGDYAVDEYVVVAWVRGAVLAVKLG